MTRRLLVLAAALSALPLLAPEAAACACCSEVGQRHAGTEAFDSERRALLDPIKFAPDASIYMPAGEYDEIQGIASPQPDYKVSVAWDQDRLVLTLKGEGERGGTLALALPKEVGLFEVDTRDPRPDGAEPSLYKEWTLSGPATGTGDFTASTGQTLTLIFQGRGNSCPSDSDFTAWTLDVTGDKADYRLIGTLAGLP